MGGERMNNVSAGRYDGEGQHYGQFVVIEHRLDEDSSARLGKVQHDEFPLELNFEFSHTLHSFISTQISTWLWGSRNKKSVAEQHQREWRREREMKIGSEFKNRREKEKKLKLFSLLRLALVAWNIFFCVYTNFSGWFDWLNLSSSSVCVYVECGFRSRGDSWLPFVVCCTRSHKSDWHSTNFQFSFSFR